jgi:hypothetical protein
MFFAVVGDQALHPKMKEPDPESARGVSRDKCRLTDSEKKQLTRARQAIQRHLRQVRTVLLINLKLGTSYRDIPCVYTVVDVYTAVYTAVCIVLFRLHGGLNCATLCLHSGLHCSLLSTLRSTLCDCKYKILTCGM